MTNTWAKLKEKSTSCSRFLREKNSLPCIFAVLCRVTNYQSATSVVALSCISHSVYLLLSLLLNCMRDSLSDVNFNHGIRLLITADIIIMNDFIVNISLHLYSKRTKVIELLFVNVAVMCSPISRGCEGCWSLNAPIYIFCKTCQVYVWKLQSHTMGRQMGSIRRMIKKFEFVTGMDTFCIIRLYSRINVKKTSQFIT
jgi:hypothetical protein